MGELAGGGKVLTARGQALHEASGGTYDEGPGQTTETSAISAASGPGCCTGRTRLLDLTAHFSGASRKGNSDEARFWHDRLFSLAFRTSEMLWASTQVIASGTSGMLQHGPTPSARDRRELILMGRKKFEAAAESATAMGDYLLRMNLEFAALAMNQTMAIAASMLALSASRTPQQAFRRQARLIGNATSQSAGSLPQLSGSAARLAQRGLKPIHSRATKNAKRLARR